ncbi:MAG: phosphopantetheine-binding protein [Lactobacillus crispatus]|nr:phosphopantetheine-binding protein [Lactobacillus crispatus]MCT7699897.1 phosphopantetheine-binding protein [Lactobacillus crispatus]
MKNKLIKILKENLEIDDAMLRIINSKTILFGPLSETGFDSIDAMAYIAGLRREFNIPSDQNITLDNIISIEATANWLKEKKYDI